MQPLFTCSQKSKPGNYECQLDVMEFSLFFRPSTVFSLELPSDFRMLAVLLRSSRSVFRLFRTFNFPPIPGAPRLSFILVLLSFGTLLFRYFPNGLLAIVL